MMQQPEPLWQLNPSAYLEQHEVKPTANRISILKQLVQATHPLSLRDLEELLDTIDRSNLFRTLTLFRKAHLVHVIEDGSESVKYELCRDGSATHDDLHVHFRCEECHRTFCLEEVHIPCVVLPEGFEPLSVNYVIKGLCPDCRRKQF